MRSVWFVMPVHGRHELTGICLRELRRQLDRLEHAGTEAKAVVVGDDKNLETATLLGLDIVTRDNTVLGRKWNDGYQHAFEHGADYVIPIGSDDVVDATVILATLPSEGEITCYRTCSIVHPDGNRMATLRISYQGGDGIKVFRRDTLRSLDMRPASEVRGRALDASIMAKLERANTSDRYRYRDQHPLQILEMKSDGAQLNDWDGSVEHYATSIDHDPLATIRNVYPELTAELHAFYASAPATVAA